MNCSSTIVTYQRLSGCCARNMLTGGTRQSHKTAINQAGGNHQRLIFTLTRPTTTSKLYPSSRNARDCSSAPKQSPIIIRGIQTESSVDLPRVDPPSSIVNQSHPTDQNLFAKEPAVIRTQAKEFIALKRPTRTVRPAKQVISLTPRAIEHLAQLSDGPEPKLIRIGVKNKGCAGMSYNLEYIDKPDKFDEVVIERSNSDREVKIMIDSRALFSIIGSTMDWEETKMGNRFVFNNPNVKEQCGCGESFMV